MVVPTYQHSLGDVIAALNAKIAALQSARGAVQERISNGKSVEQNNAVLQKINESLDSAESAKTLMNDSCCFSQNCNFDFYD